MQLAISQQIDASPQRVFAVFTDLAHAPERINAIQQLDLLTDGPIGLGTRFSETRKMFGKSATETMTITAFDPPRSYTTEAQSCGTHYTSTFTFEPRDRGTRVTMSFTGRPITLLAKLMMPLGKLMSGSLKKMVGKDMADLAAYCESADA